MKLTEKTGGNSSVKGLPLVPAVGVSVALLVLGGGGMFLLQKNQQEQQHQALAKMHYQADGYGGFTSPAKTTPAVTASPVAAKAVAVAKPALESAREAYQRGDFKTAKTLAEAAIPKAKAPVALAKQPVTVRESTAQAHHLIAFATARRGDLKAAREQFAQAEEVAKTLPVVAPSAAPGELPGPTLAEDAAYQHAACTMGLGDKAGAERELVQFMKDYPDSPLIHASMRRIARLHEGNVPKEAEEVWQQAKAIAQKHQEEKDRLASLCGPECLAELLRREGKTIDVETLAKEMKTSGDGTSLAALQTALHNHGYPNAQGVRLTQEGLQQQQLPVIALIRPGHFILVDKVSNAGDVTVWSTKPSTQFATSEVQTIPAKEWKAQWQGAALTTATAIKGNVKNNVITATTKKIDTTKIETGNTTR